MPVYQKPFLPSCPSERGFQIDVIITPMSFSSRDQSTQIVFLPHPGNTGCQCKPRTATSNRCKYEHIKPSSHDDQTCSSNHTPVRVYKALFSCSWYTCLVQNGFTQQGMATCTSTSVHTYVVFFVSWFPYTLQPRRGRQHVPLTHQQCNPLSQSEQSQTHD
jgi:hypothetical protein